MAGHLLPDYLGLDRLACPKAILFWHQGLIKASDQSKGDLLAQISELSHHSIFQDFLLLQAQGYVFQGPCHLRFGLWTHPKILFFAPFLFLTFALQPLLLVSSS